jgi:hypothetical protein
MFGAKFLSLGLNSQEILALFQTSIRAKGLVGLFFDSRVILGIWEVLSQSELSC